jgi:hypothetical protein
MRFLLVVAMVLGLAGAAWAADGWIYDSQGRATFYHSEPNGNFYTIAPGGKLDQQGFVEDGNVYLYNTGAPDEDEPDPDAYGDGGTEEE